MSTNQYTTRKLGALIRLGKLATLLIMIDCPTRHPGQAGCPFDWTKLASTISLTVDGCVGEHDREFMLW